MKTKQEEQIELIDVFAPILAPVKNQMFIGYFALLVLLLMLTGFSGGKKTKVHEARFATESEIREAKRIGLRQIALQIPKEPALELDSLVLPSLAPAVAVIGGSGTGKTRTYFDPAIKSAIDQGWSIAVLDVKGNLMKKHAAYAQAMGSDVYVYAPGRDYTCGLNFLDFMKDETDAKVANELAKVLNKNLKERGTTKGDDFFTPQGIGLLKTAFMLAKSSPFPDLFTAWKFLSLDQLADRLQAAKDYGLFDFDRGSDDIFGINTWIGEAALPLRSVSGVDETSKGIVGSATAHIQKIVDKSLMPCMLQSTIPLDLTGKQIVFFQVDEESLDTTGPLVAAAMNMFFYRNLNGKVKRKNTFAVFLDEFGSILFDDIEALVNRVREYGGFFSFGYQSDAQIELKYPEKELRAILASCPTKLVFRTGDPATAEKFSASYGYTDKLHKTEAKSYGKNQSRNVTEHLAKVPLVPANDINEGMEQGECIISNSKFKGHAYRKKIEIKQANDRLWTRASIAWDEEICPTLISQAEAMYKDTTMEVEKSDREVIADAILPSPDILKAYNNIIQLHNRVAELNS